jgi:polar amino acid transport system substrate-binding protein
VDTGLSNVAHEINNLNNPLVLNTPVIEEIVDAAQPLFDERLREEGDFRVAGIPWSRLRERISRITGGHAAAG